MGTFSKVCICYPLASQLHIHLLKLGFVMRGGAGTLQMLFSCDIQIPVTPVGGGGRLEGTCKAGQETCFFLFLSAAVSFSPQFHFTLPEAASWRLLRDASTSRAVLFPQGSGPQLLGLLAVMTPNFSTLFPQL